MRVISGYLKGRTIKGYNVEGTRPTMDRVKESLFGVIQNKVKGSTVLDLFCGSGSLGIEAISNGSSVCYFVDNNTQIINILKENIKNFNIGDIANIINKDYQTALKILKQQNIKFDIIFIDPPYCKVLIEQIINIINDFDLLCSQGLIVCEYRYDILLDKYPNLKLIKMKKYSDTYISIYMKE